MNQNLEGALSVGHFATHPNVGGESPVGRSCGCTTVECHCNYSVSFTAQRVEETMPFTFRFAEYPNGQKRLQGGYHWHQGHQVGGVVWRDLPCVKVDEQGSEIPA